MTAMEALANELDKLAAEVDRLETHVKAASVATDDLPQHYKQATGLDLDAATKAFLDSHPELRAAIVKKAEAPKEREPMGSAVLKTATNGEAPSSDPFTTFANKMRNVATRDQ